MNNTKNWLVDGRDDARFTIILAHGAAAPMDAPFMNTVAGGLAERGIKVIRFEFPYMQKRRETGKGGGPGRAEGLTDFFREVIEAAGEPGGLIIGGKSMGGRVASLVADQANVRGLVCLGYPFHPPGRPDKLRVAHLRELKTPTLVVQGERDNFGNRAEVSRYDLSDAIRVEDLVDGDHSFKPRKSSGQTLAQNLERAIELVSAFAAAES